MIGFRRGHNFKAIGAKGYICEVTTAEEIRKEIIKIFNKHNFDYIDCSPGNMVSSEDISFGVKKANSNKCDFYFSIHFNASTTTHEARGTEIWTYSKKLKQANNVLNNLCSLGFKNRGVKHNKGYYELKTTNMNAMIVEVCFVDSKADVDILKYNGFKKVAQAIAHGVMGIPMEEADEKPVTTDWKYRVCVGSYNDYKNAVNRKKEMDLKNIDCYIVKNEEG